MKCFISALCSAIIVGTSLISPANVIAEETTDIAPVYEFPVIGEVYIYEGQNYHLGDYTTLDMTVKLFIEPDGNAEFLFIADQDFVYESEKTYNVYIDNRTSQDEHVISIDAPSWCTVPKNTACEYASYITYSKSAPKTSGGKDDMYDTLHEYYYSYDNYNASFRFYDAGYNNVSNLPVSFSFINDYHKYFGNNKRTVIADGDAIGRVRVELSHPIIYVSDNQQQFIVEQNKKKYIDDDMFVTFTIDDVSITKEIGLHYYDSPAIIYSQGDVNDDGEFNITDVVLLQKWLLAVPNTNLAKWPAADMNHDSRLDVFDLCLIKRALINATE